MKQLSEVIKKIAKRHGLKESHVWAIMQEDIEGNIKNAKEVIFNGKQ